MERVLAEGEGFEPPDASRRQRFSSERQVLNVIKRSGPWVKWKQRRLPAAGPPCFSLPSLAVPVEAFDFIKISYRFFTFF